MDVSGAMQCEINATNAASGGQTCGVDEDEPDPEAEGDCRRLSPHNPHVPVDSGPLLTGDERQPAPAPAVDEAHSAAAAAAPSSQWCSWCCSCRCPPPSAPSSAANHHRRFSRARLTLAQFVARSAVAVSCPIHPCPHASPPPTPW